LCYFFPRRSFKQLALMIAKPSPSENPLAGPFAALRSLPAGEVCRREFNGDGLRVFRQWTPDEVPAVLRHPSRGESRMDRRFPRLLGGAMSLSEMIFRQESPPSSPSWSLVKLTPSGTALGLFSTKLFYWPVSACPFSSINRGTVDPHSS